MAIQTTCQFCQYSFPVATKLAGQQIECPQCKALLQISSGLKLVEEPLQMCPLCGQQINKDAEVCKACGNNVRSTNQLPVQVVGQLFKRPGAATRKSPVAMIAGILVLLCMAVGITYQYKFNTTTAVNLFAFCPEDTKVILMVHWNRLGGKEIPPTAKKLFQNIQGKAKQTLTQILPRTLQINLDKHIRDAFFIGSEPKTLEDILGQDINRWTTGTLLLSGEFDSNLFAQYDGKNQSEYQNYKILEISRNQERLFLSLLNPKVLAISSAMSTLQKVIDLQRGVGQRLPETFGGQWFHAPEPYLCKIYGGQFNSPWSPEFVLAQLATEFDTLKTIQFCGDFNSTTCTAELEASFGSENAFAQGQELLAKITDRLKRDLPTVWPGYTADFADILAKLQPGPAQPTRFSFNWNYSGDESKKVGNFLTWLFAEAGTVHLEAAQKWAELVNTADRTTQLTLVKEYLQNTLYKDTVFIAKAKVLQDSLHKASREGEARAAYERLVKDVPADNFLRRWEMLKQLPPQYAATDLAQEVKNQLEALEATTQQKIEEASQTLKQMSDSEKMAELDQAMAANLLCFPEHHAILKKMAQQKPALATPIEVFLKLYTNAQAEIQKYREATKAETDKQYQVVGQACTKFVQEQLPVMVVKREFAKIKQRLDDLNGQLAKLSKTSAPEAEALQKSSQDVAEIRALFPLCYDTLDEYKNKDKSFSLALANGDFFTCQVKKLAKTKVQVQDANKKTRAVAFEEIKGKKLGELIPDKSKEPKVLYYLGLLLWWEGKAKKDDETLKWAKKYAAEAQKQGYAAAAELLKSMGN